LSGFMDGLAFTGSADDRLDFVGVNDTGKIGVGQEGTVKVVVLLL